MFQSVLIANRGEIALRVARTLRRLGIEAVTVYSDADRDAPHALAGDRCFHIGATPAAESYLNVERIVETALHADVDAVHPGYGFLSERADFARACRDAGLRFVGPSPEAIALLGDKAAAKRAAADAGVPIVPGASDALDDERIAEWVAGAELPVMLKAAGGGGGRGMRIVRDANELPAALSAARREALAAFGDDRLIVERYVQRARHIEVQVLADDHGNAIHLGERECSLQRRHQKVIEEAPSPVVREELRARMGAAAAALASACDYTNAGTVELIADRDDPERFYFLEMNARLQVEHPVTEAVTGLDLVELQLRIASGEPLPLRQEDVRIDGHAVEARIYAESPPKGFLPAGGRVIAYAEPAGLRFDSGVRCGSEVSVAYDPLLAKAIAHAPSRARALSRLDAGLRDTVLAGPATNLQWLRALLRREEVRTGALDTALLERIGERIAAPPPNEPLLAGVALIALLGPPGADRWSALDGWRLGGREAARMRLTSKREASVDTEDVVAEAIPDGEGGWSVAGWRVRALRAEAAPARAASVQAAPARAASRPTASAPADRLAAPRSRLVFRVEGAADARTLEAHRDGAEVWVLDPTGGSEPVRFAPARRVRSRAGGDGSLTAPMPGTVLEVRAGAGDSVREGAVLVVLESMKMELAVSSPSDGTVQAVRVRAGDRVSEGQPLLELAGEDSGDGEARPAGESSARGEDFANAGEDAEAVQA